MMKRYFLLLLTICAFYAKDSYAQVPAASNPVCAECGGNEYRKEGGRWVKISDHKPGCPIAKKIAEAEAKAEAASWSPNFNSIEYKYGNGVKCEECGRVQGHVSDCTIGYCQKKILKLSEIDHTKIWGGTVEATKNTVRRLEGNIRNAAQRAREERAQAQQGGKSQQPISTKLKDHQPMPEQFPKESGVLIPKMDRMPPPVLPTTVQLVNLREKANDGTSTVYDKRIQFRDSRSVVARGITNRNGSETWTLFKVSRAGEEKIATFSKIITIDEGDRCRYFVCRDMNGKWGLYNLYGKKELDHEFSSIEAIAYNDYNDKRGVVLKCCRNGKYGLLRDVDMSLNCEYDDIQLEGERAFRVLKNGRFGIVSIMNIPLIPAEYTYIERLSYQHVPHTFYIVSKDNIKYGIFVDSSSIKYKRVDYSLGEAREQVKTDAIKIMK